MIQLRNYSHYTTYESLIKIPKLVNKAVTMNSHSLGLTDLGVMYGAMEFYDACKKEGINPVVGQEFFLIDNIETRDNPRHMNRVILFAKNYQGYQNLMRLSTYSHLDGFYYFPRIDYTLLNNCKEGLAAVCANHFSAWANQRTFDKSTLWDSIEKIKEVFGQDLYFIIAPNQESRSINQLIESECMPDKILVMNGNRYLEEDQHNLHNMVYQIQAEYKKMRKAKKLSTNDYFYMTEEETRKRLNYLEHTPKYLGNTHQFAQDINLEIPKGFKFPKYENLDEEDAYRKMKEWGEFEIATTSKIPRDRIEKYKKRFAMECEIVKDLGFSNYFLIVSDIVREAKKRGVEVGPGRGSVCGSLLAWVLDIHAIDPIKNGLYFERFLNPDRISLPDIDLDFEWERRDRVIDYVFEKYGSNRVAQICTYSFVRIKGAMKDAAKALGIDYDTVNDYNKIIDSVDTPTNTTQDIKETKEVSSLYRKDEQFKHLFDTAEHLADSFRQPSVHAAGHVIAPDDILNHTPLRLSKKEIITQYDMRSLESCGLIKMDFLGLRTMTVVRESIELAKDQSLKTKINMFDDKSVFNMITSGDTIGVFQIEGGGMSHLGKQMGVESLNDLAALSALFRPAVLAGGLHELYIDNKHGKKSERGPIEDILAEDFQETYGIPLYQESLMRLARDRAGFTFAEADTLRAAIGKKKLKLLASMKQKWVDGFIANNPEYDKNLPELMWKQIFEGAGNYSFNKSHAIAYGTISYWTAYLKKHIRLEFYCALLSSVQDEQKKDQFIKYLNDAISHKIKIHSSSINSSEEKCILYGGGILLSLGGIKGIGINYASRIRKEREKNGNFTDVNDFCQRMNPSTLQLGSLLQAQAIPGYEKYLGHEEELAKHNKAVAKEKEKYSGGLFEINLEFKEFKPSKLIKYSELEMNEMFFDVTGLRLGKSFELGQIYSTSTSIKDVRIYVTKKGQEMAYVQLKSYPGHKLLVFPRQYKEYGHLFKTDDTIKVYFKLLEEDTLSLESAEKVAQV